MCGGNARCSTCRVRVVSGLAQCPPPSPNEQRTLERIGAPPDVRLACQLRPGAPIGVVPLLDASATEHAGRDAPPPTVERVVTILLVDLLGWTGRDRTHSPHDEIYASNLVLTAIGQAIAHGGGVCLRSDAEGAIGIFGIAIDPATACGQAIDAARVIEQRIAALNARLTMEFGFAVDVALVVHAGPAAIAAIGYGPTRRRSVVGPALDDARRLRKLVIAGGDRFIASASALARAGRRDHVSQLRDNEAAPLAYAAGPSVGHVLQAAPSAVDS
jgi:adenylate cyclase